MTLPAAVESLDDIPEEAQEHYREDGGEFVLAVDGIKQHPKVSSLANAFEEQKSRREELQGKLKQFGDVTPGDVEQLREELAEAREGGDVDVEAKIEEVKEKVASKYENELESEREERESVEEELHRLLVDNRLNQAIEEHDVKPEYRPAVRAMLKEKNPTVVEQDGRRVGVFKEGPDGIPGEHPIEDFVSEWAESDAAKPYLPASGKGGSGSEPGGSGGGSPGGTETARVEGGVVRTDPEKVMSGEVAVSEE